MEIVLIIFYDLGCIQVLGDGIFEMEEELKRLGFKYSTVLESYICRYGNIYHLLDPQAILNDLRSLLKNKKYVLDDKGMEHDEQLGNCYYEKYWKERENV